MDLGPAMEHIAQSTAAAGMQPSYQRIGGGVALVARTSEFRWRWFATRLHTFLVVAQFPPGTATRPALDAFLGAATDYAIANKSGLPRGLQTGTAIVAAAVTAQPPPEAIAWASAVHGRKFAAIPFPALVDAATRQVVRPQRMVIGGVYGPYLRQMVDSHFA
jgi:hypothetical protein